jgi:hypothetical protein
MADSIGAAYAEAVTSMTKSHVLREPFAILVVHQLNMLWYAAQNDDSDDRGCCADCCAPCGIVRDLLDVGVLPDVIGWAPEHLTETWQPLDEAWLRARWACRSRPPCGDDPDADPDNCQTGEPGCAG